MIERDVETRPIALKVELRSGSNTIFGYGAVYDVRSKPLGGPSGVFVERVSSRAFVKAKSDGWPNVLARWEHRTEPEYLLGTTPSGTLRLDDDNFGLLYECDLQPSRYDLRDQIAAGMVGGSSFAFEAMEDDFTMGEGGYPLRTLLSCKLIDVAPVRVPAYEAAQVSLRSLARHVGAPLEDVEARAATGDVRGFFKITDGPKPKPKPGSLPLTGKAAMARLEEMREKLSGKEALKLTMDARQKTGRERLLQTLDESPQAIALRTSVPEAMRQLTEMAKPPVICMTEVSVEEIVARADRESAERERELAEVRSQTAQPQYRTIDPHLALRILESMKPVEPPRNAGRATDAYSAESGNRF
jgi:uncharacterized protein